MGIPLHKLYTTPIGKLLNTTLLTKYTVGHVTLKFCDPKICSHLSNKAVLPTSLVGRSKKWPTLLVRGKWILIFVPIRQSKSDEFLNCQIPAEHVWVNKAYSNQTSMVIPKNSKFERFHSEFGSKSWKKDGTWRILVSRACLGGGFHPFDDMSPNATTTCKKMYQQNYDEVL